MLKTGGRSSGAASSRRACPPQAHGRHGTTWQIDVRTLRQMQEQRARQAMVAYRAAAPFFPTVRFCLQNRTQLGESWKVCGSAPQLGRWQLDVAPQLRYSPGDWWSADVALPPGAYHFKCALRRPDGSYQWEAGPTRVLQVPLKARPGPMLVIATMDVSSADHDGRTQVSLVPALVHGSAADVVEGVLGYDRDAAEFDAVIRETLNNKSFVTSR